VEQGTKDSARTRLNWILAGIGVLLVAVVAFNFRYHFVSSTYVTLASLTFTLMLYAVNRKVWKAQEEQMARGEYQLYKPGTCPNCAYDRKGVDIKARCPECGMLLPPEGKENDPEG